MGKRRRLREHAGEVSHLDRNRRNQKSKLTFREPRESRFLLEDLKLCVGPCFEKLPSACGTPAANPTKRTMQPLSPSYLTPHLDQQLLTHYASPRSGDRSNDMITSLACCVLDLESTKTM